jgi:chromosome segregation ATPase
MSEYIVEVKNEEDEISDNIETIKNLNKNFNFDLTDISNYIDETKKLKKKYKKIKNDLRDILSNYYEDVDENPSYDYLLTSIKKFIIEIYDENEKFKNENEELINENEKLNNKFEEIENELIEIFLNCGESSENDILLNLKVLKRKLHYNFSLFNILYISCYIFFYFYYYYNYKDFNYNYIIIIFLLFIFYIYNLFK